MMPAMTDDPRSYPIDGPAGRLVVHEWGAGLSRSDAPPTLLAHPTGFHGRVWAPVARRLVAAGRRVWSFDFRGHGDSDAPDPAGGAFHWGGFAADALAVVDHLGLAGDPSFVACGHSKGAAALLLGEADRPGSYPRLWLFEPIVFPTEVANLVSNDPMANGARRRRNEWASVDEAYDAYASKPRLGAMTPESLRAYVEYGLRDRGDGVLELKCRPEVEASVYAMAPANGVWEKLAEVDASVLVACGETSRDISPALAQRVVDLLPHGRLEVWPGAGHFGPQQDPDACAESVLRFADS
jgi:pimeloyl-ACP methyl ester carboxylesterase